jgi:hypothetical protein
MFRKQLNGNVFWVHVHAERASDWLHKQTTSGIMVQQRESKITLRYEGERKDHSAQNI